MENLLLELKECVATLSKTSSRIRELKKMLVEFCPYKVGDKIEVTVISWGGKKIVQVGFVYKVEVSDAGTFYPLCKAVKKDGTASRNNVYFVGEIESIKVLNNEEDMKLEDYTTEQLKEELSRRQQIARQEALKNRVTTPQYEVIKGTVLKVLNEKLAFCRRKWVIEFSEETSQKYNISKTAFYKLLSGKFTKANSPVVGDTVLIRCRITKMCPTFTEKYATIFAKEQ